MHVKNIFTQALLRIQCLLPMGERSSAREVPFTPAATMIKVLKCYLDIAHRDFIPFRILMNACAARENIQLWATHVVAHGFDMACMLCHLVPVRNPALIRPSQVQHNLLW